MYTYVYIYVHSVKENKFVRSSYTVLSIYLAARIIFKNNFFENLLIRIQRYLPEPQAENA